MMIATLILCFLQISPPDVLTKPDVITAPLEAELKRVETIRAVSGAANVNERVACYAVFKNRPDYKKAGAELAHLARGERGRALTARMQQFDEKSRAPFIKKLRALESTGGAGKILDLYLGNAVAFEATAESVRKLATEPGILYLQFDRRWPEGSTSDDLMLPAPPAAMPPVATNPAAPLAVITASHLTQIGATDVWAKGYKGQNVVVALIDLGTVYDHPNLVNHIWTNPIETQANLIDDDNNGFVDDYYGWNFDLNNNNVYGSAHGTQTAGLIVGDGTLVDGSNNQYKTGVAPDARLMLCVNGPAQSSFWGCVQYAIANGADLVSSSQSYKWFLTFQPDYHMFRTFSDAELAAGIIHINSAGNQGTLTGSFPIPFNIAAPANSPAPWLHSGQVQAGESSTLAVVSVTSSDTLVTSSSQGPSAWENVNLYDPNYNFAQTANYWDYPYFSNQVGLLKPDVAAPTNVTTVLSNNQYFFNFSGTSASTPIVAGTVALMLSANPTLEPRHIAHLLQATALDLGNAGKDLRLGAGRINAYEAWRRALVSVKTIPHAVQIGNDVWFHAHTIPNQSSYLLIALDNQQTIVPGIATLDISDPMEFLVYDFSTATPDYPPFNLSIPYDPSLVGIRFYLQLGVNDLSGTTGTWIMSAIDWFTLLP
ncbi:MAG: S8 family serine peptidase [Planctomycetota bacterium]